ncbi:MAG TPA: acetylglutamate kinase [Microbacteriaceae bacterium]|nr:acetylglutamate kinase [Microbacteriaceae bacterium]
MDTDGVDATVKTQVLIESLPWVRRFYGERIVVKLGGNAMVDPELQKSFAEDMVYLRYAGVQPVVVHGGGPQISAMLTRLGIPSVFEGGYRVTTPEVMEVVRMVLSGSVARSLVAAINRHGPLAAAVSGEDAGLFAARRRRHDAEGNPVELGRVGDIVSVDPSVVVGHLEAGRIPVVSSISSDTDEAGGSLNVNADAAAGALAVALGAAKLVVLTNVAGLYRDWPNEDSLVGAIGAEELRRMLPHLESGMVPKMTACLAAVDGGVPKAAIIDGRVPHSILLEVFTRRGSGTEVVAGLPADGRGPVPPAAPTHETSWPIDAAQPGKEGEL